MRRAKGDLAALGVHLLQAGAAIPPPPLHLHRSHTHTHTPPARLDEVGYGVGARLLEVLCYRERGQRRETRLLDMLKFVHRLV